MHAVFVFKQEEFLAAYSKRNNIESTFSSVKRKFGGRCDRRPSPPR